MSVLDDLLPEERETARLILSNPVNAELGVPSEAALTIDDNDSLSFGVSLYSVKENDGQATIRVDLSNPSNLEVRVDYATQDGTATAGADYVPASGTLVFGPGETEKYFTVTILADQEAEGSETILLSLSNPVNAGLGAPSEATITIGANDSVRFSLSYYSVSESVGDAVITVKLSAPSEQEVRVDYATSDGTASSGTDYIAASGTAVFPPGETSQSFLVPILDDTLAESNETILLALSNPVNAGLGSPSTASLTITDNDALKFSTSFYTVLESAGEAVITVRLAVAADEEIQVDYATEGGTATPGVDYAPASGTLVFAPGETSKTFLVPIVDDIEGEAKETVGLVLSNPVNAGLGSPSTATISISDNDSLRFSLSYYYVYENVGQAAVSVRLSAASNVEVRVDYETTDAGTATPGDDYIPASGTLVFSPGQTIKTFYVTIIDDTLKESNETIKLALLNPVNAGLGSPSASTITIRYND